MKRNRFAASMVAVSLFGLVAIGTLGACSETSGPATQGRDAAQVAQDQAFGKGYTSPGYDGPAPVSPPFGLTHYEEGSGGSLAVSFGSETVSGSGGVLADDYTDLKFTTAIMFGGEKIYPNGPGYVSDANSTTIFGTLPTGEYYFQILPSEASLNDGSVLPARSYFIWGTNERVMMPDADAHYLDLETTFYSLKAASK